MSANYTQEELNEFRRLVELGESPCQMDRIESRLQMLGFIDRLGRDKCEAMFKVLKKEIKQ